MPFLIFAIIFRHYFRHDAAAPLSLPFRFRLMLSSISPPFSFALFRHCRRCHAISPIIFSFFRFRCRFRAIFEFSPLFADTLFHYYASLAPADFIFAASPSSPFSLRRFTPFHYFAFFELRHFVIDFAARFSPFTAFSLFFAFHIFHVGLPFRFAALLSRHFSDFR